MSLVVPFNFQPESVSVQTGAYSIPAGYYAHVTANVSPTGTFSIGGNTALAGHQTSATQTAISSSPLHALSLAGAPTDRMLETTTADSTAIGSTRYSAFDSAATTFYDSSPVVGSYWVPAATSLNVSSGRYVVSLYRNIT